ASEADKYDEKEVENLAKVLEILFDKSIVYDNNGTPIGFNKNIVETELSKMPDYNYIIDELEKERLLIEDKISLSPMRLLKVNPKWAAAKEACFRKEIKKQYGGAALTSAVDMILNGKWKDGAKKLLKLGVRGSIPGIFVTIGLTNGKCGEKASKKYKHYL
ncbi:MAG: hypothetical protein ACQEWU_19570, partial [Bacillota bacterium]